MSNPALVSWGSAVGLSATRVSPARSSLGTPTTMRGVSVSAINVSGSTVPGPAPLGACHRGMLGGEFAGGHLRGGCRTNIHIRNALPREVCRKAPCAGGWGLVHDREGPVNAPPVASAATGPERRDHMASAERSGGLEYRLESGLARGLSPRPGRRRELRARHRRVPHAARHRSPGVVHSAPSQEHR